MGEVLLLTYSVILQVGFTVNHHQDSVFQASRVTRMCILLICTFPGCNCSICTSFVVPSERASVTDERRYINQRCALFIKKQTTKAGLCVMKSSVVVVCGDNKLFLQMSGSCQCADFIVFTHFSSASSHFLFFCKMCR